MDLLELFHADVYVCDAGYTIRDGRIFPLETCEWEPGDCPGYTSYNPFDYPTLFLEFASLKTSHTTNTSINEDALLEFANRYGLLFNYYPLSPESPNRNTVKEWREHVAYMDFSVKLWEKGQISEALHTIYFNNVTLDAELNSKTDDLELRCDSLLSALYLQNYFAIKGNKTFNKCAWCGAWFEILPPATRNTRKFCSNACKQAEYRHRKGGK